MTLHDEINASREAVMVRVYGNAWMGFDESAPHDITSVDDELSRRDGLAEERADIVDDALDAGWAFIVPEASEKFEALSEGAVDFEGEGTVEAAPVDGDRPAAVLEGDPIEGAVSKYTIIEPHRALGELGPVVVHDCTLLSNEDEGSDDSISESIA